MHKSFYFKIQIHLFIFYTAWTMRIVSEKLIENAL